MAKVHVRVVVGLLVEAKALLALLYAYTAALLTPWSPSTPLTISVVVAETDPTYTEFNSLTTVAELITE